MKIDVWLKKVDLIIIETICADSPMSALLTGETIEMIDVRPGPHNHLERRYLLVTCCAASRVPEEPEVVPLTEDKISFGVESRANFS